MINQQKIHSICNLSLIPSISNYVQELPKILSKTLSTRPNQTLLLKEGVWWWNARWKKPEPKLLNGPTFGLWMNVIWIVFGDNSRDHCKRYVWASFSFSILNCQAISTPIGNILDSVLSYKRKPNKFKIMEVK